MLFKINKAKYELKSQKILTEQNITIEQGKHLLIIGPSGCGKTTLINLMAGLLRPTSGNIIFEDRDYSYLSDREIDQIRAENFGFIFQKLHLISHLNIEQNISLAQNKSHSKNVNELINTLGLSSKKKQLASTLSVGEAQRVAIARGVANSPKVIFADEPTSALDNKNAKNVMNLILAQSKKTKTTLIVSTHDERLKSHFSNIIEMSL